jgi:polyisoprenoid-binding protein YceI
MHYAHNEKALPRRWWQVGRQGGSCKAAGTSLRALYSGKGFRDKKMLRLPALLALTLALAAAPSVSAQSVSKDAAHAPNGNYQLEANHSQLLFSILHLGLTNYYGRFNKLSGTLSFDANQPEKSTVSITIDTNSVDAPSTKLIQELKAPYTFDTAQFGSAMFKSTSIERTGPNTGRITGDLTIKNVTKPVTLDVTFNGGGQNPMNNNYALGFHATGEVKRGDYGLTTMPWSSFVGDDVQLIIEAMFQKPKD